MIVVYGESTRGNGPAQTYLSTLDLVPGTTYDISVEVLRNDLESDTPGLVCDITIDRLCLSFVKNGRVEFYTRSALALSENTEERLAGDIQRAVLYFNRHYGPKPLGKTRILLNAPLDPDRLRSEIEDIHDAEVEISAPPAVYRVSDESFLGPFEGLLVGASSLTMAMKSARAADLIPESWRRRRQGRAGPAGKYPCCLPSRPPARRPICRGPQTGERP